MTLLALFAYRPGTLIGIAAIVAWALVVVVALRDLFRRRDLGVGGKVIWLLIIVLAPIIGVLVYFLVSTFQGTTR